jgi:hypothetical protein
MASDRDLQTEDSIRLPRGSRWRVPGTASRLKAEMRGLRRPIQPFKQLIEDCIGTRETDRLVSRRDHLQLRERGLHLGVANRALSSEEGAHSAELKMKLHYMRRERPDGANHIQNHFTLICGECHEFEVSNADATDRR